MRSQFRPSSPICSHHPTLFSRKPLMLSLSKYEGRGQRGMREAAVSVAESQMVLFSIKRDPHPEPFNSSSRA